MRQDVMFIEHFYINPPYDLEMVGGQSTPNEKNSFNVRIRWADVTLKSVTKCFPSFFHFIFLCYRIGYKRQKLIKKMR